MAAESYIRSAISELNRAVIDVQQQIHELERATGGQRSQLEREIDQLERESKVSQVAVAASGNNDNPDQKHALMERIRTMEHEKEGKKALIAQLENDLRGLAASKAGFVSQLQGMIAQLDGLTTSPDAK